MAFTFVVETGDGVIGANGYITVAQFKDHHDGRGRVYTPYTDPAIQAAIVRATDYVDKRFGRRFLGSRQQKNQGLEWPRISAYDADDFLLTGVPVQLIKAVAEYAWIAANLGASELAPNPTGAAGGIIEETVGPITTRYSDRDRPMTSTGNLIQDIPVYPEADLWIEELIRRNNRELARA